MTKNDELHVTCSCHTHELHFEKDHEDEMWYVSFWERGYRFKKDWRYMFRTIWQVLKTGRPYGDEIILEKKDLLEIQSYVKSQLRKKTSSQNPRNIK